VTEKHRSTASDPGEREKVLARVKAAAEEADARDKRAKPLKSGPALDHCRGVLNGVAERIARSRQGHPIDADERAANIQAAGDGEGVTARMGGLLRAGAKAMLDEFDETGNLGAARELGRFAAMDAAATAPSTFGRDANDEDRSTDDVVASIPR
jgi:hypothetical protein